MSTARRAFVTSAVVAGVVAGALALWHLRLLIFLLFLGLTIAAAMRPGVEALCRRGVPRSVGVLGHFLALGLVVGLLLWLAVPPAIEQLSAAIGDVPSSRGELRQAANHSTGSSTSSWSRCKDGSRICRPAAAWFIRPSRSPPPRPR